MITLFTDFGADGPYIGQVKVMLAQHTTTQAIELFSDLPACNIKAAAYLLPAYIKLTGKNSICMSVVDPGVGGTRRAIVINADKRWFVGPDNGLLSIVLRRTRSVRAWNIPIPEKLIGTSFHGRDLFAPVVATIANGHAVPGDEMDPKKLVDPGWPDDLAEVVYIDRYGNAITGIRSIVLSPKDILHIQGHAIKHAKSFSQVSAGEFLWYENANGLVELSGNCASIAEILNIEVGNKITIDQDA